MLDRTNIHDIAQGRWRGVLSALGLESRFLTGKHTPCPVCGGKDRFRFDDKDGRGGWICNQCGAGDGADLLMRFKGCNFVEARRLVESIVGTVKVELPKPARREDDSRTAQAVLWGRARPLDGQDVASCYLGSRGISLPSWPSALRWLADLPFFDDQRRRSLHPAMLAKFAAADAKSAILHRTYLSEDGKKADLPKVRMFAPGHIPAGGAVRLGPIAQTMGIAEGLETALSASILDRLTVWAALTAGNLTKWEPPAGCEYVIIYGDRDENFAGQVAAFALAHRLKAKKLDVEVRFPESDGPADFNDMLMTRLRDRIVGKALKSF